MKLTKQLGGAVVLAAMLAAGGARGQGLAKGREVEHSDGRGTKSFVAVEQSAPTAGDEAAARAALQNLAGDFGLPANLDGLELASRRESLLGVHYRFQQKIHGVPVEGADVVVSLRRTDGSVYQAANNFHPVKVQPTAPGRARATDAALDAAWGHLRVHGRLLMRPTADLLYVPQGGGTFRLVHRVQISTEAPFGHWEHRYDAETGEAISVIERALKRVPTALPDFAAYKGAVLSRAAATAAIEAMQPLSVAPPSPLATTNGSARVFDPEPRTTLNTTNIFDSSPASAFTNAYFTRTLQGITVNAGVYTLTGAWVRIHDIESPTSPPSSTTSGSWTNSRGTNAFNDVMCYFHIDQNQRYLQSLGYTGPSGIQQLSMLVDSDGVFTQDNSHFVSGSIDYLAFGRGGVDDDEDAGVILHEYGHAITHGIIPGWTGGDTGGIGEGFGDYWGGSYSYEQANGTVFNPNWAFKWDGHSPDTWPARVMNMTNITYNHATFYTAHMTVSGIVNYSDQLWSTPLFQSFLTLRGLGVPREEIDRIVIESFFGVSSSPKMRDLAAATVNAAARLYPYGPHASVFHTKFTNQLILTSSSLVPPSFIHPLPGEIFTTSQVVTVRWDRRGAASNITARLEYGLTTATNFNDTVENGTNGWAVSAGLGAFNWHIQTNIANSPARAWFATNPPSVSDQYLVSSPIAIGASTQYVTYLTFAAVVFLETGYDGGVVEVSTNSGATWADLGTNAIVNGYDAIINNTFGNPIGGRLAFTGTYGGFYTTVIPLTLYTGKTINIRFRVGTDNADASYGWIIDDVQVLGLANWTLITNTTTNVSSAVWKTPDTPATNYQLRLRHMIGTNASAWVQTSPLIVSADTDGDGLPDAWETKYFTNTIFATGTTDRDGDGASDLAEFHAGTLPNNASSVFRLTSLQLGGPTNVLQWSSVSNRAYLVEFAPHITNAIWTTLGSERLGIPPLNVITDTPPAVTTRYYRVRAQ